MYFYMFGFEEYYNGLIEEAKSPEEIRKILHYQFEEGRGVPGLVIDRIIELDPTKKKSYTKWVLNNWEKETNLILESIKNHKLKKLFDYFQSRQNNGLNLTDMSSVKEAMDMMPEVDNVEIIVTPNIATYTKLVFSLIKSSKTIPMMSTKE